MGNLKEIWMNLDKKIKYLVIAVAFVAIGVIVAVIVFNVNNKNENEAAPKVTANVPEETTQVPTQEPTQTPTATPVPEPTIPPGMVESSLTGQYVDEKIAAQRPYAVMFNNLSVASPQSGISEADILYECVTEGGITRLMGIFQQITSDKVGSLRSARHYFVSFAKEWDVIFIHCGGSDKAYEYIDNLKVDDIDGIKGIGGSLIYRDKSIKAPHNAFTTKDKIEDCMSKLEYRTESKAVKGNHFSFNKEDVIPKDGQDAGYVSIKYSYYTTPYFKYNSKTKLYERYQFDEKHTDKNTGKTLTFKNIIIMNVDEWNMDKAGRQDMAISNNKGDGWYISNGKAVPIKWTKNESKNVMKFLDNNGKLLSINKGKTYIGVLPLNMVPELVISKSK